MDTDICLQLMSLWGRFRSRLLDFSAQHGLTPAQVVALFEISKANGILMGDLARQLHCDASNVTGLTDRLIASGLVDRQPSPADRRAKQLIITPAGSALVADVLASIVEQIGLPALSRSDAQQLYGLLSKVQAGAVGVVRSAT